MDFEKFFSMFSHDLGHLSELVGTKLPGFGAIGVAGGAILLFRILGGVSRFGGALLPRYRYAPGNSPFSLAKILPILVSLAAIMAPGLLRSKIPSAYESIITGLLCVGGLTFLTTLIRDIGLTLKLAMWGVVCFVLMNELGTSKLPAASELLAKRFIAPSSIVATPIPVIEHAPQQAHSQNFYIEASGDLERFSALPIGS